MSNLGAAKEVLLGGVGYKSDWPECDSVYILLYCMSCSGYDARFNGGIDPLENIVKKHNPNS